MLTASAIRKIRKHKPKSKQAFEDLGFRLKHIGSGAFRRVYQINNLPLVVKIPNTLSGWSGLDHAKAEIENFRYISKTKRFSYLWRFLPTVYYANLRHGIIVMKKVSHQTRAKNRIAVEAAVESFVGHDETDMHRYNIGKNRKRLVILDLGLCA